MTSSSLAALVLGAALGKTETTVAPAWETSYARAAEAAVAQRKPLAVFLGRGEAGYTKVVGGDMPSEAGKVLAANYVALYVNTETAEGQRLAGAFGVNEGLVISCRGCQVQALRHGGPVPAVDLAAYLTRYSADNVSVTTTERAGTAAVVAAPAVAGCANGRCGTVVQGGYYAPAAPVYYGGFSNCPNGRCPNAR